MRKKNAQAELEHILAKLRKENEELREMCHAKFGSKSSTNTRLFLHALKKRENRLLDEEALNLLAECRAEAIRVSAVRQFQLSADDPQSKESPPQLQQQLFQAYPVMRGAPPEEEEELGDFVPLMG